MVAQPRLTSLYTVRSSRRAVFGPGAAQRRRLIYNGATRQRTSPPEVTHYERHASRPQHRYLHRWHQSLHRWHSRRWDYWQPGPRAGPHQRRSLATVREDPPCRSETQRPGGSLPGPDAGHPLRCARPQTPCPLRARIGQTDGNSDGNAARQKPTTAPAIGRLGQGDSVITLAMIELIRMQSRHAGRPAGCKQSAPSTDQLPCSHSHSLPSAPAPGCRAWVNGGPRMPCPMHLQTQASASSSAAAPCGIAVQRVR